MDSYLKAEKNENKAAKVSSISVSDNNSKNVIPPEILWHLRLGHLSHDRMQCMNKMYGYIPVSLHTVVISVKCLDRRYYLFH
jgi:hypothetical protein